MSDYIIISDSTTDLTPDLINECELEIIPLLYTLKGKDYYDYADERDMKFHDFYEILRGGDLSTTSLINTERFLEIFESHLKAGRDVLYIGFSSGLSGTYNASRIAVEELKEKYPDRKIYAIDSLAASMGEGLLVYLAAKEKEKGKSIDEVVKFVLENRLNLCHWFTVDDLFHLYKGGRVSKTAATVGSMLNIKPVLHVDDEGHLIPISKVRGRKMSITGLFKNMKKTAINPEEQVVFISHGDCLEEAEVLKKMVMEKLGVKKVYMNYIGPVIGTHSGPGTIALFYLGEHR